MHQLLGPFVADLLIGLGVGELVARYLERPLERSAVPILESTGFDVEGDGFVKCVLPFIEEETQDKKSTNNSNNQNQSLLTDNITHIDLLILQLELTRRPGIFGHTLTAPG